MSSNRESKLAEQCDSHIFLPLERELCPFDLAPVTSTALQMIFGDVCAVAIMEAKALTAGQFHANTPTSRMDRNNLTVRDLMRPISELAVCDPERKLMDVLPEMSSKGHGCVLVCGREQQLAGVFTDGDLRRRLALDGYSVLHKSISTIVRLINFVYF